LEIQPNLTPKPTAKCKFNDSYHVVGLTNTRFRYRRHTDWVKLILIRRVEGISEVGLEEKNDSSRFEKAFKDVPKSVWHVFSDPEECRMYINDAVEGEE
jgi:hypothetical protein